VHRSGRTGRAGADGVVVTFVAPDKLHDVRTLQRTLDMRQQVEAMALEQLTGSTPKSRKDARRARPRPAHRR
jgi:superfamily II DNA/RNA helicase